MESDFVPNSLSTCLVQLYNNRLRNKFSNEFPKCIAAGIITLCGQVPARRVPSGAAVCDALDPSSFAAAHLTNV